MTAQITDSLHYAGTEYTLCECDGGPLFTPEAHGLQPVMMHTACWRGFYLSYELTEKLLLRELTIQLDPATIAKGRPYPRFEGVLAKKDKHGGGRTYGGLSLAVPFSGAMLIGHDFVEELYEHGGFPPAWKFVRVFELILSEGKLEHAHDRSAEAAAVRDKAMKARREGSREAHREHAELLASTFGRYDS
jgi:hypothetical protein